MYTNSSSPSTVNTAIRNAVATFLDGQYFGTTIQLSDLLSVIHNVSGVDNVRWSRDIVEDRDPDEDSEGYKRYRVVECDVKGRPLLNLLIDRRVYGDADTTEVQIGYFTGSPTGGTFTIKYQGGPANPTEINWNDSAGTIQTKLGLDSIPVTSVTGSGTVASPFVFTFSANGFRELLTVQDNLLYGDPTATDSSVFDSDFFLKDDELPALPTEALDTDTVAGLTIRPRAQNTWNQL
jgi:hypothetical protein